MAEERNEPIQLELKIMKVNVNDITVPSYAVVPISSDLTQNNVNMPYMSAEDTAAAQAASTGIALEMMNHRKVDTKLDYISTKDIEDPNRNTEEVTLLATDIVLADFNEHAVDVFNNNENYNEFKVFNQITESNAQHDNLTNITGHQNQSASLSKTRDAHANREDRLIPINLEQKIMQDGLQNAIAHVSEGTDFTSDMKQYKNGPTAASDNVFDIDRTNTCSITDGSNALYSANCITSHIPDIISSSSEANLFDSGIEALSFINDATLQNESLDAVSHDLCSNVITNTQSEAVELAIATEEELPAPWIDVMALATAPALRTQSWSELNAFPTAVHSLVDLVGPEPYPLEIETQLPSTENLKNIDTVRIEHILANTEVTQCQEAVDYEQKTDDARSKKDRNVLQEITADADICKCVDCKCDNLQNCQNCTNTPPVAEVTHKDTTFKIVDDFVSSLQSGCSCNTGCDSCCVVICLKTLQQLQKVFSRNCCKSTSSATCCREKLLPSLLKCKLAKNQ